MKKKFLILLGIIMITLTTNVYALETREIKKEKDVKEINKFYTKINDNINIKENINGDSLLLGDKIIVNNNINGIGFIAGSKINIKGNLNHGFIIADKVNITGTIKNSLYSAGTNITLEESSKIEKDAFLAGEKIILNGTLNRDVKIIATSVIIKENTTINNNITINATNIKIEKNTSINGILKYNEDAKTNIHDNVNITKIEKTKIKNQEINKTEIIQNILNLVITFSFIIILFPTLIEKIKKENENNNTRNYIRKIAKGIILITIIPIICTFLLISNIGISIGLILTTLYIISLYIAYIFGCFILGNKILIEKLNLNINENLSGIITITVLNLLTIIPIFGFTITILITALGITTIWNIIPKTKLIENKK